MGVESSQRDALVHALASGQLRGSAGFEAIVAHIAATEVGAGASSAERRAVFDEVASVVTQDRELCRMLLASEFAERLSPPPPQQADLSTPRQRRSSPEIGSVTLEHESRPEWTHGRRPVAKRLPSAVGRVQAWSRGHAGWLVAGLAVATAVAWWWADSEPTTCDMLVRRMCFDGGARGCDEVAFADSLRAHNVDNAQCLAVLQSLSVPGDRSARGDRAFDRALVAELGFDPRGRLAPIQHSPAEPARKPATVVVSRETPLVDMVVRDGYVYGLHARPPVVFRVRAEGGDAEVLVEGGLARAAQAEYSIADFAVRDNQLFWLEPAAGARKRGRAWVRPLQGDQKPRKLRTGRFDPLRAAYTGERLAFVDRKTGAVMLAHTQGRPRVHTLVPAVKGATREYYASIELGYDNTHIYVAQPAPTATIWRASILEPEQPPIPLATGQLAPTQLAVDASHVYWAEVTGGGILRTPKAGGALEVLTTGQTQVGTLAFDTHHIYWPNAELGQVLRVRKTGGEVRVVAEGLVEPRVVTVGDGAVYYDSDGSVVRSLGGVLNSVE